MDKTEFNLIMLKLEALEQQMANGKAAAGAAGGAAGGASSGSATGDGNSLKAEDAEKAVTFNPRRRSKSATDITTAAAAVAGKEEVSPMIAPRTRRTRSDHGSMHLNTVKESSLSCR